MNVYRFSVKLKQNGFIEMPKNNTLSEQAKVLGFSAVKDISKSQLYFVRGNLSASEEKVLAEFLFCDELYEYCLTDTAEKPEGGNFHIIETALKAGVTDSSSREALRAVKELGIKGVREITSGSSYKITGNLTEKDLHRLAKNLLCNEVIERYKLGAIEPAWTSENQPNSNVEIFDIALMDDKQLLELSEKRRAALDLKEMKAVREYYRKTKKQCTDAEFETIAQTWSEHCVHKTFKAKIYIDKNSLNEEQKKLYPDFCINSIIKTYIKKATDEINAPWVLSAFVDNAGIIEFDDKYEISFKAETHNHPSAIEPFGGANTGVGGVIRDVMGVSARPFAVTDVLCFGLPDMPAEKIPEGTLHPKRIISGVIEGVKDYGNKMGIPTVNGGVHYHEAYTSNPLVYCGCAGIAPRGTHRTKPFKGDRIISLGGKTGRDGLRGATFSSMVMDASTGDVAGSSVQIGEPIIQKKVLEVLLSARDRGLYNAITDCGAGGYSSAVGEMASVLGCDVDLSVVPVKYAGLAPWEIWLSEAQERMVIAVPEKNLDELKKLSAENDVELTDLGFFTGDGILTVRFADKKIISLDCSFLHSGPPQKELKAAPPKTDNISLIMKYPGYKTPDFDKALNSILNHHAVNSKEDIVRLYDHEVQGGTILRPYGGAAGNIPQDAAVVKPMETDGKKGVAISNALNPGQGLCNPYAAAAAAIDEAVRNAVAVGADPEKIAILDNFCLGAPTRPDTMWTLLEMARSCYENAVMFGTPFISGKDSFNNEYLTSDGKRVAIPPSLLISAIGIVPDIAKVPGTEFKKEGSSVYLVGKPEFGFAGSVFAELFGIPAEMEKEKAERVPPVKKETPELYKNLHKAISQNCVLSCHDLSEGGLAVTLHEMSLGGIGIKQKKDLDKILNCPQVAVLFGETTGCLTVEIPQDKKHIFEKIMEGSTFYCIGETYKI
ncbi:phosphoribosylformylglycinamidine synthase subunit PurL [Treponema pedis]|uniref:phosphoribosylformylglycinamidine synthase subunit PurL n=1 Tax=Treponema pedis TaxID=409322 RepID=UPI00197F0AA2|nr:phosphoribosylformylglycinamidine synthase subunit PurL [Treponema pedis]QSI05782.1 phosphoribosylformylglycinamidine synthase subunit PurL [Treponema pedis]